MNFFFHFLKNWSAQALLKTITKGGRFFNFFETCQVGPRTTKKCPVVGFFEIVKIG